MIIENQDQFFNEIITKIKDIAGIDIVYFIKNNQVLKEHRNTSSESYLTQVQNMVKSESLLELIGSNLFSNEFHTYSLLNESGLMIISKFGSKESLYMIIVAGENEPVDLLNLLKICKETQISFHDYTIINA